MRRRNRKLRQESRQALAAGCDFLFVLLVAAFIYGAAMFAYAVAQ